METVPIKLNNCQTSSFLFVTSIYVEFLKHIENVHYFKNKIYFSKKSKLGPIGFNCIMEIHLHALPNSHQIIPQGTNREITSFIKLDVSGE